MKIKCYLYCSLCSKKIKRTIDLPGWARQSEYIEEENGLCPDHANIEPFLHSQCDNCVGGWADCSLWNSFALDKRTITERDLSVIREGRCPRRTNSTFLFNEGQIVSLDSSSPEKAAGEALAKAIEEYIKRYGEKE